MNRRRLILLYAATLAGTIAWLAALIAAPYLRSRGSGWGLLLHECFAPLCHQRPERSFRAFGYPLAVCARCTGIYGGFLLGLAAYPFRRGFALLRLPPKAALAAATLPLAADAAGNLLGLWNSPAALRFLTGLAWGAILPFYFLTGVGELITSGWRKR